MTVNTKKTSRRRVKFSIQAEKGSKVFVAGTFNEWNPKKNKLTDKNSKGLFSTSVLLPEGSYEYKFVVNDVWCVDPDCPDWKKNRHGTLNSLITVA